MHSSATNRRKEIPTPCLSLYFPGLGFTPVDRRVSFAAFEEQFTTLLDNEEYDGAAIGVIQVTISSVRPNSTNIASRVVCGYDILTIRIIPGVRI